MRIEPGVYADLLRTRSAAGSVVPVLVAYVVFGFARHSYRIFIDPLAIAPLVVDGLFSWVLLSFVAWLVLAVIGTAEPLFVSILRATGHAHVALVTAATAIFLLATLVVPAGATRAVGAVAVVWFAAAVGVAISASAGDRTWRAAAAAVVALFGWSMIAGRELLRQAGHLL